MKKTSIDDAHLLVLSTREVGLLMAFIDTGDMTVAFPRGFSRSAGLSEFIHELYEALGDTAALAYGGDWADGSVEYVYDDEIDTSIS